MTYRLFQDYLAVNPKFGDVVEGTGGIRKIRFKDEKSHKGKRGGLRILYYWWQEGNQIWLIDIYAKSELTDLSQGDLRALRSLVQRTLKELE